MGTRLHIHICIPKSGQPSSRHLGNTHNVVTFEAFDEGHLKIVTSIVVFKVVTYYQDVYDETSSGHSSSDTLRTKIEVDTNFAGLLLRTTSAYIRVKSSYCCIKSHSPDPHNLACDAHLN